MTLKITIVNLKTNESETLDVEEIRRPSTEESMEIYTGGKMIRKTEWWERVEFWM